METRANRSALVNQSGRLLQFKCCTRCGGDMHQGRDIYSEFNTCLQCGHTKDVISPGRMAAMMAGGGFEMGEVA
ncbi:MAG: hypothetical protein O2821_05315 [Chloroflexi bacterium]|nr:hypothetical protein [Chloroflexota bacterium]MDA1226950.1 hypothetical protein [Chloroflexota bacterium]